MGALPHLIYYASVCTSTLTIAEYLDGDAELPQMVYKCLQVLPLHHSRLSHTANGRMFACIIDHPFLYCTIADEALNRSQVMSFLEQVQHEFSSYASATGLLAHHSKWEAHSLDIIFDPIFRRLVGPCVGIPQKEKDRMAKVVWDKQMYTDVEADVEAGCCTHNESYIQGFSCCDACFSSRFPSTPLMGKTSSTKYKHKKYKDEARDVSEKVEDRKRSPFNKVPRLEITRDMSSRKAQGQVPGSAKNQQVAQKMWWRNVKIILMVDASICLLLLCIWLGLCKGLTCMKED